MSHHLIGYLILFLPLFSSLLCLLINLPRSNFLIYLSNNLLLITSSLILAINLPNFNSHITSEVSSKVISAGINYDIGILGLVFILLITFIKTLTAIFYKNFLQNFFNDYNEKLFYAINLLNLSAVIGIFSTNNIINLYLFIEIYSLTFYAISCSSKEKSLNELAFRYFYQGSVGSVLILISLLFLYINFETSNFDEIFLAIKALLEQGNYLLISLIFIILIFGIILKFFPFWLYFRDIRSADFLSHFILSHLLFVKVIIGFYLLIKLVYFIFGSEFIFDVLRLDLLLLPFAFFLIFYGNINILRHNNFKVIIAYFCLIYFGFFLIVLSLNSLGSLISAFFFILHYSLIGFLLLLICGYMVSNFKNCNVISNSTDVSLNAEFDIKNLIFLQNDNWLSQYLLKILILFIVAFPLTFLFMANWQLSNFIMQKKYIILIFIPIFSTFIVFANLAIKMLNYLHLKTANKSISSINLQDNIYYLTSLFLGVLAILIFALNPKFSLDIFRNLALYLL